MDPLLDEPSASEAPRVRTFVYVDAANLYRMKLKNRAGRRWLNLEAFFDTAYPDLDIVRIHYFVAKCVVEASASRQAIYLEVLESDAQPRVEVHRGHFSKGDWNHFPEMLAESCCDTHFEAGEGRCCGGPHVVRFKRVVEKCTDVNIATCLVADAAMGRYDVAILVTNDGDLAGAVKLVRDEWQVMVRVFDPGSGQSKALAKVAGARDFPMSPSLIESSQFPLTVTNSSGKSWHMPPSWAFDQPRPADEPWRRHIRVSVTNTPSTDGETQ